MSVYDPDPTFRRLDNERWVSRQFLETWWIDSEGDHWMVIDFQAHDPHIFRLMRHDPERISIVGMRTLLDIFTKVEA